MKLLPVVIARLTYIKNETEARVERQEGRRARKEGAQGRRDDVESGADGMKEGEAHGKRSRTDGAPPLQAPTIQTKMKTETEMRSRTDEPSDTPLTDTVAPL